MWLMVARAPREDAAPWPVRRGWAAIDALLWPLLLAGACLYSFSDAGLLRPMLVAGLMLVAAHRVRIAQWMNHRYRVTTGWVVRVVVVLFVLGWALKAFALT